MFLFIYINHTKKIEPVQRVPRYELLIKEVIRYTPEGHPNHAKLVEALKEIKVVADGMNLDMGCCDSRFMVCMIRVIYICLKLESCFTVW
jgi:hypothetical protein